MIGLIFDVDGVIGNTEAINEVASVAVFQDLYGVAVQREDFHDFIGTGSERYLEGVAEKYGVRMDLERAVALRQANILRILREEGLAPYPGVLELIGAASRAADARLAIATSGPKAIAFPILDAAGVDRSLFDAVITGDQVTRKKPDPQIYRLAAEGLGVPAAQCVVVEDAPAGVAAAKAAGMKCIAVTTTVGPDRLAAADRIVPRLDEVSLDDVRALAGA